MWKIIRQMGGYPDSGYPAGCPSYANDMHNATLDPIKVAGCADMKALKSAGAHLGIRTAFRFMLELTFFVSLIIGQGALPETSIAPKWQRHFAELVAFGLVEEADPHQLKSCSGYFAVEKSNGHARCIFSGRALSQRLKPPPPVNFPYLPEVMRRASTLVAERRKAPAVIVGDFRHFFHQLRCNDEVSEHFGMRLRDPMRSYIWRTLPMGISWSPFCAQSVGWTILGHKEEGEPELLEWPKGEEDNNLPSYVKIQGGGFGCLFLDNYLFVGVNADIMVRLEKRIDRNCRLFGIVRKEHSFITQKQMRRGASVKYLGAEMTMAKMNTRLQWRHEPDRLESWKGISISDFASKPATARQLASLVGRIVWRTQLALEPLCRLAPIIAVLRRAATAQRESKEGWETRVPLTPTEEETLQAAWTKIMLNEWSDVGEAPTRREIRVCTDSSDTHYGYVVLGPEGQCIEESPSHEWPEEIKHTHIFFKEAIAAIRIAKKIVLRNETATTLRIAIDNSAAAHAMRNMVSSNSQVCKELDDLAQVLHTRQSIIDVVSVRSEDNAADPTSRNRRVSHPAESHRLRASHEVFERHIQGIRLPYRLDDDRNPAPSGQDCVRHKESLSEVEDWLTDAADSEEDPVLLG
jgi:hypothetical protein